MHTVYIIDTLVSSSSSLCSPEVILGGKSRGGKVELLRSSCLQEERGTSDLTYSPFVAGNWTLPFVGTNNGGHSAVDPLSGFGIGTAVVKWRGSTGVEGFIIMIITIIVMLLLLDVMQYVFWACVCV